MNNIKVLNEATASKIAAGEVIERPAGVLKELLENAVDAGASCINVDIEGSGKTLIRINDNGCGMSGADLKLSVLRHATSKIENFSDLEQLQTFGFRGEALYSVAAVSRMRITSCVEGGEGSCIEVRAGEVVAQSPAPCIKGTTVEIRDLFFNTPARLKFLKSDAYERACLLKVIEESALANLSVSYRVCINGREYYNLPSQNGSFRDSVIHRASAIFGEEVAKTLLFKEFDSFGLKLFLSPTDKLVTVRDMQYVFVNRRPIDSKTTQQAIYKAYQNVRGKDRHPVFLVYMTLDPSDFDVNIHPQKRDIRFSNEHNMFGLLMNKAGETVFSNARPVEIQTEKYVDVSLPRDAQNAAEVLFSLKQATPVSSVKETPSALQEGVIHPSKPFIKPSFTVKETEEPVAYRASSEKPFVKEEKPADLSHAELPQQEPVWFEGPYHYLGQLQKSYLLFENPKGLVLIDQHAAQERVLFEHYLDAFDTQKVEVQKLLFPIHVDLPPSNAESLLSWGDWLKTAGFEIEPFSAHTVLVRTMPHVIRFKEDDMKAFIISLAQVVGDPSKSTETLKRKMVAMLACKKAIKAHDQISVAEAEALLEKMKNCRDGMHCPHGRPCVVQVKMKDIDKLFGR